MSDKKYSVNFATANGNSLSRWRAPVSAAVDGFPVPASCRDRSPPITQLRCWRESPAAVSARESFAASGVRFAVIDQLRVCYPEHVAVDFDEFEQLVLKVLFETDVPVTAAHVAYLGRISVRTAERHLARMVEQGTLNVRTNAAGIVEYVYPGRKPLTARVASNDLAVGPPPISVSDGGFFLALRPRPNPVTSVMLSMLIPGAGHIYSGRPGAGIAWMATTLMGYACCFLPGLFLHGLCLVSAAQTRRA